MKYKVLYECKADGSVFHSEFEVESPFAPATTDSFLIELALKHAREFHKSGQGGISITSVNPLP